MINSAILTKIKYDRHVSLSGKLEQFDYTVYRKSVPFYFKDFKTNIAELIKAPKLLR